MKCNLHWAGFLAFGSGLLGAWAGTPLPLPTPFPEGRYQRMSARSPFAIATASAPVAAATPGFASQLYVDGVAHIAQSDFVAIKSRDPEKPAAIFLEVGKSTVDGLTVDRVQWSDQMGKSTVEVSKNGEKAMLAFDEAQITKVSQSPPQVALPESTIPHPMLPSFFPAGPRHRPGSPKTALEKEREDYNQFQSR